ncbi:hypothetical protein FF38_01099 [Lucilia cuprina]|uniref:FHA domain-containing protein n=1 Tax=Lucilia cuprina TaxID=7375 RepID=A0A0L0BR49_LUCCU|nr:hypothetical protein FF38_01099 [Lucilia cuprina]
MASQNRLPSQMIDPRDIGDEMDDGDSQIPGNPWAELETSPQSIPSKDLFLNKPQFFIGRHHPDLDKKTAYNGPLLDHSYEDQRLSRVHCMLERVVDPESGKFGVWVNAYHLISTGMGGMDDRNIYFVSSLPSASNRLSTVTLILYSSHRSKNFK